MPRSSDTTPRGATTRRTQPTASSNAMTLSINAVTRVEPSCVAPSTGEPRAQTRYGEGIGEGTAPLLTVTKHCATSCGTPPSLVADDERWYRGYFESVQGAQVIFRYDYESARGWLIMGDAGWERRWEVIDGLAEDLVLSCAETFWPASSWAAVTRKDPRLVVAEWDHAARLRSAELESVGKLPQVTASAR